MFARVLLLILITLFFSSARSLQLRTTSLADIPDD